MLVRLMSSRERPAASRRARGREDRSCQGESVDDSSNAAKDANASRVHVTPDALDGALRVCVRDHGVGGADPTSGSELIGLTGPSCPRVGGLSSDDR